MSFAKPTVVHFHILKSVFDVTDKELVDLDWTQHKPLSEYLGHLSGDDWAVSINGGEVVEMADWGNYRPVDGDHVVVAPIPHGGEGESTGKTILRIVALVAVSWFTLGMGGIAGGSFAGGAFGTGLGAQIAATAAFVGGTMLVNALLPPPEPGKAPSNESSPTYGIDGAKNTSREGVSVPLCYGGYRMGANVIATHVENHGDDQFLYMLINAGEGEIAGFDDFQINDQPADNYQNVEIQTRNGTDSQDAIKWFNQIITPRSVATTLDDNDWKTFTTLDEAEQIRLDVVFPAGLGYFNDKGRLRGLSVTIEANVREYGTTSWLPFRQSLPAVWYPSYNPYYNPFYSDSTFKTHENEQSPIRRSFYSTELPRARYDVRYRRTREREHDSKVLDLATVTDINEITFDKIRYKHTALVALRVRLDEQLSGIPQLTYLNQGILVKVWDDAQRIWISTNSNNPAWIAWDLLTHPRRGAGLPESRMDFQAFLSWAKYCDAEGLTYEGMIDQASTLWDQIAPVFRAGRAQPTRPGLRYSVAVERPKQPSMLFNVANIKKGSFKMSWMGLEDRANDLDITYWDKNEGYKQRIVNVYDKEALAKGAAQVKGQLTLVGVTTEARAMREGIFALNVNKLSQMVTFEAPISSIACTVGDVINVQHDMPQWGYGGLLEAGGTPTHLKLDRPVTMDAGKTYRVMVNFDALEVGSGSIHSLNAAHKTVYLNDFDALNGPRVRRMTIGGVEYQVNGSYYDTPTSRHGVVIEEDITGLMVGQLYQAHDTDITLERDVVLSVGEHTEIDLASALGVIPAQHGAWAFGETDKVVKPFTVRRISGNGDHWREITAMEYVEAIFDDEVIDPPDSHSDIISRLGPATLRGLYEELSPVGINNWETQLAVEFSHDSTRYGRSDIYYRVEGGRWELVGTGETRVSFAVEEGWNYDIRAVPIENNGARADFDAMPIWTHFVVGQRPDTPEKPISLIGTVASRSINLQWYVPSNTGPGRLEYLGNFEIYMAKEVVGNPLPTFDDAELIQTTQHNYANVSGLAPDTFYYFWIRAADPVYPNEVRSELEGPLSLQTLSESMIDLFPNGIGSQHLTEELNTRLGDIDGTGGLIEKVDGMLITVGNVTAQTFENADKIVSVEYNAEAAILAEQTQRVTEDETLAQLVNGVSARVGVNEAAMLVEQTARSDADTALSQQITTLSSTVNDDIAAALQTEQTARADADSALASDITALEATVSNDITAALQTEQTARSDADTALSQQITTLQTKVGNDIAAAIQVEQTARSDADDALASDITTLAATVNTDITAALQTEETARANGDSALSQQITTLETTVNDDITAALQTEQTARADADTALASDITTLQTKVGNDIAAALQTEQTARSDADTALASDITTLTAAVNGDRASLQATQEVVSGPNGLSAQWMIKTDVNGRVSGFGLYNDGATSQFVIDADVFAVGHPTATNNTYPFRVVNNLVVIDEAVILDGSIGNAKIGNVIQSDNWPSAGWQLTKAGSFQMKSASTGGRIERTAEATKVYDANGVKRVQIGNLAA